MDYSKQYGKMADCPEIRGACPLPNPPKMGSYRGYGAGTKNACIFKGGIWLPMQDQLQEMVWDKLWQYCSNKISSLAWGVWNFYTHADENYYPDSMEQLWLAFVMKEKYNKTWDGEKWTS